MPVIKMMTIIVLVALMAIAMEEMFEASSSTSFAMEEPTRMTRMILISKDNNKSSTKFFMKENNKDEEASGFDSLYGVPRKEENVLGKKNKENSEIKIKVKVKGGSLMWEKRTRKENSLFQICGCAHNTFHFTSCIPWQVVEVAPFWRGGDGNYEWRGMQGPSSPKIFKPLRKPSPFPSQRWWLFCTTCWRLEAFGEQRRREREEENDFNQK